MRKTVLREISSARTAEADQGEFIRNADTLNSVLDQHMLVGDLDICFPRFCIAPYANVDWPCVGIAGDRGERVLEQSLA